jgi:hypothetical protein
LANAVAVGGDPAKAEIHGYVGWLGDRAILTVRNPAPVEAEASIPFDASVWYRGPSGKPFHARVIYPYQTELATKFTSGRPIQLSVPPYTLVTVEIVPGAAPDVRPDAPSDPPVPRFADKEIEFTVPDENMQRADLLLIRSGSPPAGAKVPDAPQIELNGRPVEPTQTAAGPTWSLASLDLREQRGKHVTVEILTPDTQGYLVLDRPIVESPPDADPRLPFPISQGYRRQSVQLSPPK